MQEVTNGTDAFNVTRKCISLMLCFWGADLIILSFTYK